MAEHRDRVQQVVDVDVDVGADRAGGPGGVEQAAESTAEVLREVGRQGLEGRVAGVQRGCEPALGGYELGVPVEPPVERFAGIVDRGQLRRGGGTLIHLALEHGRYEVCALRKVSVQRTDADAGRRRYLPRGCVHSRRVEDSLRRIEQGVDAALRVRTSTPRRVPCWSVGRRGRGR